MKNRFLLMTEHFLHGRERLDLADQMGKWIAEHDYDGLPTKDIKMLLTLEDEGVLVISADSRMLDINMFEIDNIFIYNGEAIKPIRECTQRILRTGHSLYRLYNAGEFKGEN